MVALFIVLNDFEYLDDILEAFVKLGVQGATIVDSYGMGKALRESKRLGYLMKGPIDRAVPEDTNESKTIFSVVDESQIDFIMKTIENLLLGSRNETVGFMFAMPVSIVMPVK